MTEMDGIARRDLERLSAFLDGELSPAEAEHLEARLATDRRLSDVLEALRATSVVVGSLPEVRPPRSFALTHDMVRPRRAYPILQLGTAAAALGFVLVVGADLLLSSAAGRSVQAPEQAPFAADQLTEQQIEDSAPTAAEAPAGALAGAEAPAMEDAIAEDVQAELAAAAEPEAETGQSAGDGVTEGSEEAADELEGESAAVGESEFSEQGAAEPAAGGYAEFAGESAVEQEAAGGAEQEALKAAADEDPDTGRLAATELDFSDEDPSVSLSLLRVIEIGLAAALIVLIGLTLWVRQRG